MNYIVYIIIVLLVVVFAPDDNGQKFIEIGYLSKRGCPIYNSPGVYTRVYIYMVWRRERKSIIIFTRLTAKPRAKLCEIL